MKIANHDVTILSNTRAKVGCTEVSVDEIIELLRLMKSWEPPKPKFQVGDFVRVREDYSGLFSEILAGACGKIVILGDCDSWGVEFAQFYPGLHDLNGKTKIGHGLWFNAHDLELA